MKTLLLKTVLATVLMAFCATVAQAGNTKVDVCHFPPGNPDNYHTITVSEKALSAHLAHGDLTGACNELCSAICDDGDACTIDDGIDDCEQNGCPGTREIVDCNDGNECTDNSCDPGSGCVNAPRTGESCSDDVICTAFDTCNASGECVGTAIENCCIDDNECSQALCDQAACDLGTNRCVNDPVVCTAPTECQVSVCDGITGDCAVSDVIDGSECDDGDAGTENDQCTSGVCAGETVEASCPCEGLTNGFATWDSTWTPEYCNNAGQQGIPGVPDRIFTSAFTFDSSNEIEKSLAADYGLCRISTYISNFDTGDFVSHQEIRYYPLDSPEAHACSESLIALATAAGCL